MSAGQTVQPVAALEVVTELPASPLILVNADAMKQIVALEAEVASLANVVDAESSQRAWDALRRATTMEKQLEQARTKLKQPFIEAGRRIDDLARGPAGRLANAKTGIRRGIEEYDRREEEKRREEERKRQEEIARLERERRALEEKARREREEQERLAREEAERAAKAGMTIVDDFDEEPPAPTATEQRIAEVATQTQALAKPVPAQPARPLGASMRVTLEFAVTDVARLPESLLMPRQANAAQIRALYCTGWKDGQPVPQVAGLKFEVRRTPITR